MSFKRMNKYRILKNSTFLSADKSGDAVYRLEVSAALTMPEE